MKSSKPLPLLTAAPNPRLQRTPLRTPLKFFPFDLSRGLFGPQMNCSNYTRTSTYDSQAEVSANAEKAAPSQALKACNSRKFEVALSVHMLKHGTLRQDEKENCCEQLHASDRADPIRGG